MQGCSAFRKILFLSPVILLSCGTVPVYKEANKPVFISNEIFNTQAPPTGSFTVLSFNIEKAEKIQQAIAELQFFETTTPVDVYLLQEMDEAGVQTIAEALHLNYLYIPIVYNKLLKKNIGNAILAKGTIASYQKLMLPHKKWMNGRWRHVTVGEVNVRNKKMLVYSVHTETSTMSLKKRMEQLNAILDHAEMQSRNYKQVVIGGDFNTLFPKDAKEAVKKFNAAGYQSATDSIGHTATAFYGLVKPREDHIFFKGFRAIRSGKIESSKASDHLPVYAILQDSL